MKPTGIDNLTPEYAGMILELSQKLDIAVVERLAKAQEDKFYIETSQGEKRLLRINATEHYEWIKNDARAYEYIASSGIRVMRLIGMDVFHGGALSYQLFTWFDGEDLMEALPRMSHAEQFSAAKKTGELLRKLHALPPLDDAEPWGMRYGRKVREKIRFYNDNSIKSRNGDLLARYLKDHLELLKNRPQTFTHGNFNPGNMMLSPDGQIGIIDLGGGNNSNDPWWDFWEIPSDLNTAAHFYTGLFKGYFEGEPPLEFFRLLSYYVAYDALEGLCESTWEGAPERAQSVLDWFDDMRNPVPAWYLPQME